MSRAGDAPEIRVEGRGLHSGEHAEVRLRRGAPGTGLRLRVAPGDRGLRRLEPDAVVASERRTVIRAAGRTVETVEHLLAALAGLSYWDVELEVRGREVPILDGSAAPWVRALERWGVPDDPPPLVIDHALEVRRGDAAITLAPADELQISVDIEFPGTPVGAMRAAWDGSREAFLRDIAPARTFGFTREVEALLARGLIAGGALESALVYDDDGPVNEPRSPLEPARHKVLDMIGDLALLGRPLRASLEAHRPGHALTLALVEKIASEGLGRS